jgi:serine/threonine-protein kinase
VTGLIGGATSRALVASLTFGSYVLVERIGLGARSEVFRAHKRSRRADDRLGPPVALKRVLAGAAHDRLTQETLSREAELLKSLDHSSVVRVLDDGVVSGVAYVVYELVAGADLERVLSETRRRGRTLPLDFGLSAAIQLAEALVYVHSVQVTSARLSNEPTTIIHRDVCPSNILLGWDGVLRLADFEIAKVPGRNTTTGVGEIKGTIRYMSPEQVRGDPLDSRSDLYSAGAVLLELFGGRPLFEGMKPIDVLQRLAGAMPAWNPDANGVAHPELQQVLRKVLARERGERYDTATQLLEALRGAAEKLRVSTGTAACARTMGELFPKAVEPGTGAEESRIMADEKGGSDLDVFEGLAKKSVRPSNVPGGAPVSIPAPKPGATPLPLPPPGVKPHATTLVGVAAVPPPPAAPVSGLPPPPSLSAPNLPPPSLKPAAPKTALGLAPSPGAEAPKSATPPPPPPPPKKSSDAPPISKAPNTLLAAVPPPPAPPASIGSAVGMPANKAAKKEREEEKPAVAEKEEETPPKGTARSGNLDMDWEDDEESTHVFENQKHGLGKSKKPPAVEVGPASKVGAAAALLASSGGAAQARPSMPVPPVSAPPPPAPVPPPAATRPSEPAPAPAPVAATPSRRVEEPPPSRRREGSSSKVALALGGLAMVAVVALAVYMFIPRTGQLRIDLKSKSGAAIPTAAIYVDGVKVCDTTPCLVNKVDAGQRAVKAVVGEAVVEDRAMVEPGKERSVFLTLDDTKDKPPAPVASQSATPAPTATAASEGTGFKLSGPVGVKLLVDGKERGVFEAGKPIVLNDLAAGDHKLKLDGGELYESTEKTVAVSQGKLADLGEEKLKVKKGKLSLELKTEGASVTLSGKQDGKTFQKEFTAKNWEKQPLVLKNLDPSGELKITAKKKGFADFTETVTFVDGQAERSVVIDLSADKPAPVPTGTTAPTAPPTAPPTSTNTATAAATTTTPPPAGNATLTMNSIPISKVVLNGRPLGNTPQSAQVPPGSHTVMFIHPEKGKKSVTVTVKAGEKKGASVKF